MKDEIKEILFQLEIVARKHTVELCEDGSRIETMPASLVDELRLNNYSSKLLLNYITNLQDKIKELEQINEEHRKLNGELREENEKLREENKHIFANVNDDQLLRSNAMNYAEAQDYKTRNNKAIEYMNNYNEFVVPDANIKSLILKEEYKKIIDILQGKSDE